MDISYWKKQVPGKPLFPEIEWSKPERRDQAGKLAIIGGNKLSFAAVAESYMLALETGVGQVRVLLPDCLKKSIPASMTDVIFSASTPSGSLGKDSEVDLLAISAWADTVLLIGDAGRNAETAIAYETFFHTYTGAITITRDAIDLIKNNPELLAQREHTTLVASFAQMQKLFQALYYPKMLTFSMQLLQLVEALHKFTTTYPCTIVTLHNETILIAHNGEVITQAWGDPMLIWRGTVATKAAAYSLWNKGAVLKALAASIV